MPKPTFPAAGEAMPAEGQSPNRRRFFLVVGKAGAAAAATATLMNGLGAAAALSLPARAAEATPSGDEGVAGKKTLGTNEGFALTGGGLR